MNFKKAISVILTTAMAVSMTSSMAVTAHAEEAADKIIVFQSKVEIIDQLEELAEVYEEETGVEVEVWGTTGDDYMQQLKTKMANNQGPTVFSLLPGSESETMANYEEDLSDLSFVDKIAEGMADTNADGQVVGIPYTMEGFGMVYNKDLINAEEVTDYDSFVKMLQDQAANDVNGFGLSQESYFLIGHILNTPFALQENPAEFIEKLNAGEVKMADTPEFQEFAKFYEAIRDNSYNPLEENYDKECGDFATGKTAAIHQGNWCYSMFEDYDVDFEMGMAPLPLCGNDKIAVSVPAGWYVNSQASDAEKQAGKDFLEWLYTSETGADYLMNQFGFLPVVEGMESESLDPISAQVAEYAAEGKTISWPMNLWPTSIVDVYLVPVAQEFFTSDMDGAALLEKLDEAWAQANEAK
ncbi:ABC transporter substrate-binding protein [Ruminococcus sp. 5_1_39BFAA]|uniref:ABC transporter substrate-binding protein n=1 Tax=Ruminococcus sp. 5_1_39BFAA TaxID=457412 RepID=UPI00356AA574